MRRIIVLLTVAAMMAVMMVVSAMPAWADSHTSAQPVDPPPEFAQLR